MLFPFIALLCVLCGYLSAVFLADVVRFSSALILFFPLIALLCFYVFPVFYNRHRIPAYTVLPYTGPQMSAASK